MFDNAALSSPLFAAISTRHRFFSFGIRASLLLLLLRPRTHAHSLIFLLHLPSRRLTRSARVYDRNSFTRSSPVTQRNVAFLPGLSGGGIKCARGQGISDGDSHLRSFLLSLSLPLPLYLLPVCEHRSKRKRRKTRLFTLGKNLTTTFTKRLRIYAGLKDETRGLIRARRSRPVTRRWIIKKE